MEVRVGERTEAEAFNKWLLEARGKMLIFKNNYTKASEFSLIGNFQAFIGTEWLDSSIGKHKAQNIQNLVASLKWSQWANKRDAIRFPKEVDFSKLNKIDTCLWILGVCAEEIKKKDNDFFKKLFDEHSQKEAGGFLMDCCGFLGDLPRLPQKLEHYGIESLVAPEPQEDEVMRMRGVASYSYRGANPTDTPTKKSDSPMMGFLVVAPLLVSTLVWCDLLPVQMTGFYLSSALLLASLLFFLRVWLYVSDSIRKVKEEEIIKRYDFLDTSIKVGIVLISILALAGELCHAGIWHFEKLPLHFLNAEDLLKWSLGDVPAGKVLFMVVTLVPFFLAHYIKKSAETIHTLSASIDETEESLKLTRATMEKDDVSKNTCTIGFSRRG